MPRETWTDRERKIARRVFDAALRRELAEVMAEFKSRAASAREPEDMWSVEEYLSRARRDVDGKYDYRYSQLELVFGRLLRERRIEEPELHGLSEEKLARIRLVGSL